MWGVKMSNPSPLFSNIDYYRNRQFQRLMRNWNKYIMYSGDEVHNEELMFEWEELLLKDFLKHSREWLDKCKEDTFWREGLE
jgi:hypothetical protein